MKCDIVPGDLVVPNESRYSVHPFLDPLPNCYWYIDDHCIAMCIAIMKRSNKALCISGDNIGWFSRAELLSRVLP